MTVRRLKKAQRGPWCSYCPEGQRARAIYRGCGFTKFSCVEHLTQLGKDDERYERDNAPDCSEAAFQIFWKGSAWR